MTRVKSKGQLGKFTMQRRSTKPDLRRRISRRGISRGKTPEELTPWVLQV